MRPITQDDLIAWNHEGKSPREIKKLIIKHRIQQRAALKAYRRKTRIMSQPWRTQKTRRDKYRGVLLLKETAKAGPNARYDWNVKAAP